MEASVCSIAFSTGSVSVAEYRFQCGYERMYIVLDYYHDYIMSVLPVHSS